jgi:hypothetical protein
MKGEPDLLPPYLRDVIKELIDLYSVRDEKEYIEFQLVSLASEVEHGMPVNPEKRRLVARCLRAMATSNNPIIDVFGPVKGHANYTRAIIIKLVEILWHNRKHKIKPEYIAAGYHLATDWLPTWPETKDDPKPSWYGPGNKPAYVTRSKDQALEWIAEFLNMNPKYVRNLYYDRKSGNAPLDYWPFKSKVLE